MEDNVDENQKNVHNKLCITSPDINSLAWDVYLDKETEDWEKVSVIRFTKIH